jgi:hypothetical protein
MRLATAQPFMDKHPRPSAAGASDKVAAPPAGLASLATGYSLLVIIRAREVIFRAFLLNFHPGGYYRNPVNWKGLKSRNFRGTLKLPKTAIYRSLNRSMKSKV